MSDTTGSGGVDDADLLAWLQDRGPEEPPGWPLAIDMVNPARSFPVGGQLCLLVHPAPHVTRKLNSLVEVGAFTPLPHSAATSSSGLWSAVYTASQDLIAALPGVLHKRCLSDLLDLVTGGWGTVAALLGRPESVAVVDDSVEATRDLARTLLSRARCYGREEVFGGLWRDGFPNWMDQAVARSPLVPRFVAAGLDEEAVLIWARQAYFTGAALAVAEFEFFTTPPARSPDPFEDKPVHHHRFDYLEPYALLERDGAPVVAYRCTREGCEVIQEWPKGPEHDHRFNTGAEPTLKHRDGRPVWRCVEPGCPTFTWG